MATKRSSHLLTAVLVDIVLVAAFGVIGHFTHHGTLDPSGVADTAWPFLVGLGLAWLLTAAWREPLAPLRTGTGVWAATVLIGMMIRGALGEGTIGTFIVVAGLLNFATLVGWRVIARAVGGKGGR